MFKSLREFTLDKEVNRKRLKIRHVMKDRLAYTEVQLWDTIVVRRLNINNVTSLNSGRWRTHSTKITINTALKCIYGQEAPYVYQKKYEWYIKFTNGDIHPYFDGMIIGGGSGAKFAVLS